MYVLGSGTWYTILARTRDCYSVRSPAQSMEYSLLYSVLPITITTYDVWLVVRRPVVRTLVSRTSNEYRELHVDPLKYNLFSCEIVKKPSSHVQHLKINTTNTRITTDRQYDFTYL